MQIDSSVLKTAKHIILLYVIVIECPLEKIAQIRLNFRLL